MLQPVGQAFNYNLSFRTTSAKTRNVQPTPEKKSELIEYLEAKDKSDRQNQIVLGGISMLFVAFPLLFYPRFYCCEIVNNSVSHTDFYFVLE